MVRAVRAAGKPFDAKLLVRHDPRLGEAKLQELDRALEQVSGVKNTGAPDEKGEREITLDLAKKTSLADLKRAAASVGVALELPLAKS